MIINQILEEMFKVAALGFLQGCMQSPTVSCDHLNQAVGWQPGDLESRLWDHEAFSSEDLCHLIVAAGTLASEEADNPDQARPLDQYNTLFKTVGFRDGALLHKVQLVDQDEKPENAWSIRLLHLISRHLLQETLEGHCSAETLEATLRHYAELVNKKDSEPDKSVQ